MADSEWPEEHTPAPFVPTCPLGARRGSPDPTAPAGAPDPGTGKPPKTVKILLIEDNRGDTRLIQELLREASGFPFELESADRLTAGLTRLGLGGIDIVLLDLTLPDSRGLDTFLRLHAVAPKVPTVLLSGLDDETLAIKAVQRGAEDYLVKGHMDASGLVRAIRYAIERTRRRHAEQALRATEVKLRMARQIQQKLFPAAAPCLTGYDIAGGSFCAEATGGDYFDYIPMCGGGLGIVVADVSGHGFGPALLMASTRAYLRALAQTHSSVADILTLANQFLSEEMPEDCFVTLLLARLDPPARALVYASAGHTTGYVLDGAGNVKTLLESTGFPLGIDPEGAFQSSPVLWLEAGELVLIFTDGIVEARSARDEHFGLARALDVVLRHRDRPACEIITELYLAVRDFCRDRSPLDDVTAVVIKVGAGQPALPPGDSP
jgi:serine phosphatase RsbU (regulator of sigma subunit)